MTTAFEVVESAFDKDLLTPGSDTRSLLMAIGHCQKLAKSLVVSCKDSFALAEDFFKNARVLRKKIDEARLEKNRPILEQEKAVNKHAKTMIEPLREVEDILGDKIGAYHQVLDAQQKAEEEKLKALDALFGAEEGAISTGKPDALRGEATTSSIKLIKRYRIADLKQVPAEFLLPNDEAIEAAIKIGRPVPGIEIYTEAKTQIKLQGKKK